MMAKKNTDDSNEKKLPLPEYREKILIVDDEEIVLGVTGVILRDLGYNVTTEVKSVDAFDRIVSGPDSFDLVITYQAMPILTGDQLASKIHDVFPHMPVILCTGYSSLIDTKKAAAAGFSAFIIKPIDKDVFVKTVRRVLDNVPIE